MTHIKTIVTQLIEVTPKQLADIFWEMDGDDQAEFFHQLFLVSDLQLLDSQMHSAGAVATEYAKRVMYTIGKYGEE